MSFWTSFRRVLVFSMFLTSYTCTLRTALQNELRFTVSIQSMREVPGSIPSQGPHHTKDVITMVPVVPLFSTQHRKGKHWLFLKN